MTCIIGYRDHKARKVYVKGDRLSTVYDSDFRDRSSKIWRGGKDVTWVMGLAGRASVSQAVRYQSPPLPELPDVEGELMQFLVSAWRPQIRDAVERTGQFIKDKEGAETVPGTFLLAVRNRLFLIDSYLSFDETEDDFIAIGEGRLAALATLGAIERIAPNMGVTRRLEIAITQASRFCRSVDGPFDLLHT
jgi:ATP-dependent protease HslVU (ClpYQ) peptidase subunit